MVAVSMVPAPPSSRLDSLPPPDGARKREIKPLTGLRFLAAFFILFGHSTGWLAPFSDNSALPRYGDIPAIYGMPLFFVLSGFVIHYTYGHLFANSSLASAGLSFLSARFARLYPLFLFCFLVGSIVDLTAHWLPDYPLQFIAYIFHFLTLTQSWFYIVFFNRDILNNGFGLSWSISTEAFFYICYVGFVLLLLRLRRPRYILAAITLFAAFALALFIASRAYLTDIDHAASQFVGGYISLDENWDKSFIRWLFYYSPYARIFEFILGCLTAQLYISLQSREVTATEHRAGKIALGLALGYLAVFGWFYAVGGPTAALNPYLNFLSLNFGCAMPIAVLIFCVSRYDTIVSRMTSGALIVAGGEISYSIYAVHTWTLRIFIREPVSFSWIYLADAVLRIGIAIVFTLIVATATYRLIERPWRDRLRAVSSGIHSGLFPPRAPRAGSRRATVVALAGLVLFLALCAIYQLLTSWVMLHLQHPVS